MSLTKLGRSKGQFPNRSQGGRWLFLLAQKDYEVTLNSRNIRPKQKNKNKLWSQITDMMKSLCPPGILQENAREMALLTKHLHNPRDLGLIPRPHRKGFQG